MTNEEAIGWLESLERLDKEQDVALEMAIEALQERKTGKWYCDMYGVFRCSSCGKSAHLDSRGHAWLDRYCSQCGAKMEVDE